MKPHLLNGAVTTNTVTVLEDVPAVVAVQEEPPADPVDTSVQDAPARLRHCSEEQTELPDEAGE